MKYNSQLVVDDRLALVQETQRELRAQRDAQDWLAMIGTCRFLRGMLIELEAACEQERMRGKESA